MEDKPSQEYSPKSKSSDMNSEGNLPENAFGINPKNLQEEFQNLVEKKFGGRVQVLSMEDSFAMPESDPDQEFQPNNAEEIVESFDLKPKEIKSYFDRFVVGQDKAKQALAIAVCDHYNHLKVQAKSATTHYQKQNLLIMGPTGVGKTYLVRLAAELIGVPFIKADATRFSEVGYMGANVDDVIRDLVNVAGGDKSLAAKGIVYVDEMDKLAGANKSSGRDVSGRGVQFGFLRLLEDSDVDLNASHDMASQFKTFMSFQKKGKAEKEIVNTRDILFIFSGAFHGLEDLVSKRLNEKSIGLHSKTTELSKHDPLKLVEASDLVDFGFEHEFIGRLPVRVSCHQLSVDDLLKILKESDSSVVKQYQESFANYGIKLTFTDEALVRISELALKQKTGARGLVAVIENILRPFKFELPSTDINELQVNVELVRNPEGYLDFLTKK